MKRMFAAWLALALVLLTGCGAQSTEETGAPIDFYYSVVSSEATGSAIGAETVCLEEISVENLMTRLLSGPEDTAAFARTFPVGTTLQSYTMNGGTLTVDFSDAFSRLSGLELVRAEYCVVLTLCQLEGVSAVAITVNGSSLPEGVTGAMNGDSLVLKGETEDPVTFSAELYFPLENGRGLGTDYREIEVSELTLITMANAVLTQLKEGTAETDMRSFLSGAGTLEVVEIQNGICVINMDSQTMSCLAGDEGADMIALYALVDSLTELDGIHAVSFRLDGDPINGWSGEYTATYEF